MSSIVMPGLSSMRLNNSSRKGRFACCVSIAHLSARSSASVGHAGRANNRANPASARTAIGRMRPLRSLDEPPDGVIRDHGLLRFEPESSLLHGFAPQVDAAQYAKSGRDVGLRRSRRQTLAVTLDDEQLIE